MAQGRPITWKNIAAPDNTLSAKLLESAGESFNKVATPLQNIVKDYQQTQADNIENETRINTEDQLAQLQGIDSLKNLRANKPNISTLRDQFGSRVNIDPINTAYTEREDTLRQRAADQASQIGKQVYADTGSKAQAQKAYMNSLRENAVREQQATSMVGDWQTPVADQQLKEDITANTNKIPDILSNTKLVGRSNTAIQNDLRKALGKNYDKEAAEETINDVRKTRSTNNFNDAYSSTHSLLRKTGDPESAITSIKQNKNLPAESKIKLIQNVRDTQNAVLNDPNTKLFAEQEGQRLTSRVNEAKAVYADEVDRINTARSNYVLNPDRMKQVKEANYNNIQGLINEMTKTAQKEDNIIGDAWRVFFGPDGKSGKELRGKMEERREKIMKDGGFSKDEANAIILDGFQRMGGLSDVKDPDERILLSKLNNAIVNVQEEASKQKEYDTKYLKPREKELEKKQRALLNNVAQVKIGVKQEALRGALSEGKSQPLNLSSFDKLMDINGGSLPPVPGARVEERKEKEKEQLTDQEQRVRDQLKQIQGFAK